MSRRWPRVGTRKQTALNEHQKAAPNERHLHDLEKYCMSCKKQGHERHLHDPEKYYVGWKKQGYDHEECMIKCNFCREMNSVGQELRMAM